MKNIFKGMSQTKPNLINTDGNSLCWIPMIRAAWLVHGAHLDPAQPPVVTVLWLLPDHTDGPCQTSGACWEKDGWNY